MTEQQDQINDTMKRNLIKAQAIKQATTEVIAENRDEIIRRAKAKLVSLGMKVEDNEIGTNI